MDRCGIFLGYFYIKRYTGKRSGVDSKCAICIWKLLLWTHIMQSKELSFQVKQTIVRLQKQNKSIREIAGTLGVAKSTVWYILRKKRTHWWAQQHKKAWTSTEDNSGEWSEDPLHGKENPFLSQHPAKWRTHSRRKTCHCQSLQSREDFREQIQRVHHKVQTRPD